LDVRPRALLDLSLGQHRPRLALARRVADARGEVADDEDGPVAEVLELAQLAEDDGVADVEVRPRGVHAELDEEGLSGLDRAFQLGLQGGLGEDVGRAAAEVPELLVGGEERGHGAFCVVRTAYGRAGPLTHYAIRAGSTVFHQSVEAALRVALGDVVALVVELRS